MQVRHSARKMRRARRRRPVGVGTGVVQRQVCPAARCSERPGCRVGGWREPGMQGGWMAAPTLLNTNGMAADAATASGSGPLSIMVCSPLQGAH
jgi:hypothetical protein